MRIENFRERKDCAYVLGLCICIGARKMARYHWAKQMHELEIGMASAPYTHYRD